MVALAIAAFVLTFFMHIAARVLVALLGIGIAVLALSRIGTHGFEPGFGLYLTVVSGVIVAAATIVAVVLARDKASVAE